ncbi:SDR family oxidoreductase, partial [Klebsiella pneumoniae]|uniref:SDR family oxidoreductase n=1 Tax=Klebsiella pneumoniae TaxID=573 RepID=UPI003A88137B
MAGLPPPPPGWPNAALHAERHRLGRAIALRLAAEGARVAVNDRVRSPGVDAVVDETGGVAAIADVSDPDAVERMVAEAERELGGIDVLVANHAYMSMAPFVEHEPGDWW